MEAGFKHGHIALDGGSYYTGQEISGSVQFNLDHTLLFKAINLEIIGEARVEWKESQAVKYQGVKTYGEVLYKGHKEYFNHVQCLCGGQGVSQLPPRSYTLSFKFQIPHNVPSTFKGENGHVSYFIRAYVELPDPLMPVEEITREFQVIAPYDVSNIPEIKQPTELVFEEMQSSCCLCSSGLLHISAKLPASGFCPGDTVPVSISVQNESNVTVKSIILQIVSRERYRSQQPRAETAPPERLVVEGATEPVRAHSQRSFTCDLALPSMVLPNLSNCGIIDLEYFFKVKVKLSGCNNDLEQISRIHLGMIPPQNKGIGWSMNIKDQMPKGQLPDPGTPVTPGITVVQPSFPVASFPGLQSRPASTEIGFVMPSPTMQFTGYPRDGVTRVSGASRHYVPPTPSAPQLP